jgi:hypothetical protein
MRPKFTFITACLALCFIAISSAYADDKKSVDLSALKSIGYAATGETKRCISNMRIRKTEIIDNSTIIFHMSGGKTYANIMDRQCYSMRKNNPIKYRIRGGTLCNVDVVEVGTPYFPGPICSLGDFYQIEKINTDTPEAALDLIDPKN